MRVPLSWLTGLALLLVGQGCVTTGVNNNTVSLNAGVRPNIETDEAGLWMATDKLEKRLASSGRIESDPELNQYIRSIVCKLSKEHCNHLRIYIVRTPHFNASMAPNGTMQVWTGLLLRAENEAQLAYILGHEIGHYVRRHTVQQWRDLKTKSDVMTFFSIATAAAGVGYIGSLGQLAALSSALAFSRAHESEADDIGFDMMVKAGYDPREAANIWAALEHERKAADEPGSFIFFSTHPPTQDRIKSLTEKASAIHRSDVATTTGNNVFLKQVERFRFQWLRDDLRNRKLAQSEVLYDRLLANGHAPVDIHFYKGELYRIRSGDGDLDRAINSYRKALSMQGSVPQTHRSIGLVYWKQNQLPKAKEAFETYLKLAPNAQDHKMVKSYLNQI